MLSNIYRRRNHHYKFQHWRLLRGPPARMNKRQEPEDAILVNPNLEIRIATLKAMEESITIQ
jgi:hypothetical protein